MKDVTPTEPAPQGLVALASRFIEVAAMPWHEPFPGLRMKVLYKDDEAQEATILFETQPGTVVIPEHVHGGVEWRCARRHDGGRRRHLCGGELCGTASRQPARGAHPERSQVSWVLSRLGAFRGDGEIVS